MQLPFSINKIFEGEFSETVCEYKIQKLCDRRNESDYEENSWKTF